LPPPRGAAIMIGDGPSPHSVPGMAIAFKCPNCQTPYKVKDDMAGRKVVCTACKKPLKVPAPSAPVAAPAVPDVDAEALAVAALAESPASAAEEAAASITVECPNCIEQVTFPADKAGKQAPCPNCRRVIRVPIPATGKQDWRTADARPTFAKVTPETDLKGAVGTHQKSIVSREALEEAGAIRERPREPIPLRTKITYGIIIVCAVALAITAGLLFRSKKTTERRDHLIADAIKVVTDDPSIPAGVRAETYRAAAEYVLALPDAKADVANNHLKNALAPLKDRSATDYPFERIALLSSVAVTQAGLVGNAEQVRYGQRLEWSPTLRELQRTLEPLDEIDREQHEGVVVAVRDLARALGSRGANDTPAIRALLANRLDPANRADAMAAAGLELFAADDAGKKAATEMAQDANGYAGNDVARLPRLVALNAALRVKDQPFSESVTPGVRIGLAEGLARRGDLDAARAIAMKPGSPEDRFQALVALACAAPADGPDLAAAVKFFAESFQSRDLPDWPLIRLARRCAQAKAQGPAKDLNAALAALSDPSPRSEAVRAWVQMELLRTLPVTADSVNAITPKTALGHHLAWEWLARRSPGAADKLPEADRPLSLVGTALGSLR
jgi:predicted Zn finger-like uncharacterized protein